jgi:hypothetical protein
MTAPTKIRELTKNDLCDRCGAPATVALWFKTGELLFCGHHLNQHNIELTVRGALIVGTATGD